MCALDPRAGTYAVGRRQAAHEFEHCRTSTSDAGWAAGAWGDALPPGSVRGRQGWGRMCPTRPAFLRPVCSSSRFLSRLEPSPPPPPPPPRRSSSLARRVHSPHLRLRLLLRLLLTFGTATAYQPPRAPPLVSSSAAADNGGVNAHEPYDCAIRTRPRIPSRSTGQADITRPRTHSALLHLRTHLRTSHPRRRQDGPLPRGLEAHADDDGGRVRRRAAVPAAEAPARRVPLAAAPPARDDVRPLRARALGEGPHPYVTPPLARTFPV